MAENSMAYGLFVVYDTDDRRSQGNALRALGSSDPSVLTVDIPAGTRRASFVVRAILDGLGKQTGTDGEMKSTIDDWTYARAWVEALGFRRMVVLRAHQLTGGLIDDLAEFGMATGLEVNLVVVPEEFTQLSRAALRNWGFLERSMDALLSGPAQ